VGVSTRYPLVALPHHERTAAAPVVAVLRHLEEAFRNVEWHISYNEES
jgi:hypothetical protein